MFKKNIHKALCVASATVIIHLTHTLAAHDLPAKIQQLYQLQDIAHTINRLKPLGSYMLSVPPFIEFTTKDVEQFLAGIPSGKQYEHGRKKKPLSMLEYINSLWNQTIEQARRHKKITPVIRDNLIEIRAALENAFRHDLLNGMLRPQVRTFLERQTEQKNSLIIRPAPTIPLFAAKGACSVSAKNINAGILKAMLSYFSEKTMLERIRLGILETKLDLSVIFQSMISEDAQGQQLIVSGLSCSYDALSNAPNIVTIKSLFGDAKALEKNTMFADTYYVHDGSIYPLIRTKTNRFTPDAHMMRSRLTPNNEQLHNQPTLSASAVHEIARATTLLEQMYHEPICLTFVKRDNTIYLLKVHTQNIAPASAPSFFDTLYTNDLAPERKVSIKAVKPSNTLVVIKKREKIVIAPNVRTFFTLLAERKNPEQVAIGLIQKMPAIHSKEYQLLEQTNIPIVWSPDFEQLRSWISERNYPLVFDIQQGIAFSFSRCRGFCTLFQGVQNGVYAHPLEIHISALAEFLPSINQEQREMLKPDEHFSGVSLLHLFNLLKYNTYNTAQSALNTLLFRLQKQIMHEYITKKECAVSSQPYDGSRCERLEQQYTFVERVAYQLYTLLQRQAGTKVSHADELEKMFLVNVLQALVMQQPDASIVKTESFLQLANNT